MIIIDAINGLPALGARACTISTAKSRQPPPHNLALFHELRCKAVHDARKVLELRCKAEHSFANLTIISRGGARRPPREAATVSSAPQGRWWGRCATGVADGLPLDDVAPAVEGSGRETQCREAASREDALCAFVEQLLDVRWFAQGTCCPHRCLRNVLPDPSDGSSQLISKGISIDNAQEPGCEVSPSFESSEVEIVRVFLQKPVHQPISK